MLFLTFYPQESYAQVRPGSTSTPGSIPLPGSGSGLPGSGQGQFPGGLPGQNTNTGSGNLPQEGDQAAVTDTTPKYPPAQQRVVDSLKALSDLQGPVSYGAQDSIVYDVKKGVLYLYDNSSLDYDNLKLQAIRVDINMDDQMLKAFGQEDSSGVIQGKPVFTQDGQSYQAKEVSYNFATQKGRIIEGRLQEGEGFILAEVAKYHPDGSFHGKDGKYTTCDLDHPHFYIKSQKLKMLPDNQLISGPLNLVIADFPIPLFIPFGFIPNNSKKPGQKRKNGLILPQYGEADDRGFFLRNLGYYWGISDFLDLKLDGDIYTRGGWRAAGTLNYNLKYRFQGSFRYQYGVQRFNDPLDPDFSRTTAWQVNWSHNQPIDPTARISASVNMSSSNSFQRNISNNQTDFFTNNLNSSVTFSKNFNNLPFSLSGSMRHQQDLNKETMTMQLPEVALNMKRQTPFKNIRNSNLKFLKQWGINYNMQGRNTIETFPDTAFGQILFRPEDPVSVYELQNGDSVLVEREGRSFYRNGIQHRASTSTTIKVLKQLNISPSFNYTEYWYTKSLEKVWNAETQEIDDIEQQGFTRGFDFNGAISANTNFYGIYQVKSKRDIKFRQRFSPSVSYNIRPDFSEQRWGFYQDVQKDTLGNVLRYSIFEDGIYRGPGQGESQSISFNMGSVIEMKYLKKEALEEDFEEKDKYIRTNLLDNLSVNGAYNFAADSFQLSTINLQARTSLFKNKLNVNTSFRFDPYVFGPDTPGADPETYRRQNTFMLTESGQLGRLTNAQVSLSASFRSNQQAKKTRGEDFDEYEFQQIQNTAYQYVDFDIPWTLRARYNLSYSNTTPGKADARITSTMNLDGDFNFTPKWKIGFQTGFNLVEQEINQTRLTVFRDLHCWEMAFSWIPFGPTKSYSLTINVRSATLRQLRLSKNNFWQDRFRP